MTFVSDYIFILLAVACIGAATVLGGFAAGGCALFAAFFAMWATLDWRADQ